LILKELLAHSECTTTLRYLHSEEHSRGAARVKAYDLFDRFAAHKTRPDTILAPGPFTPPCGNVQAWADMTSQNLRPRSGPPKIKAGGLCERCQVEKTAKTTTQGDLFAPSIGSRCGRAHYRGHFDRSALPTTSNCDPWAPPRGRSHEHCVGSSQSRTVVAESFSRAGSQRNRLS
jgi:hypothetical protein